MLPRKRATSTEAPSVTYSARMPLVTVQTRSIASSNARNRAGRENSAFNEVKVQAVLRFFTGARKWLSNCCLEQGFRRAES